MALTPDLRAYLAGLPGRCTECCRHIARQGGHAEGCRGTMPEPVPPDDQPALNEIEGQG